MRYIPDSLRQLVIERAGNRCEYCGLAQAGQAATFHIDHVIPIAAGGTTVAENLALACVSCSLRKGAKLQVTDAVSGRETSIYNPRTQEWSDHFQWDDTRVVGISAEGRTTVHALDMNRSVMVAIPEEESFFGRHPPSWRKPVLASSVS
jgi:hypothetical protein